MKSKKPIVYIAETDWNKLLNYAQCAYDEMKSEIGGMAEMVPDKDGDMWIKRPTILKQEVAPANCDLDETALAQYYGTVAKKYGSSDFLWWHSHADMSAFWSATDKKTIEDNDGGSTHTWSLVLNIDGDYIMQLDVFNLAGMKLHKSQEFELCFIRRQYTDAFKKKVLDLCEKSITTSVVNKSNHIGYYRGIIGGGTTSVHGASNVNQLSLPVNTNVDYGIVDDTIAYDGMELYNKATDMVELALTEFNGDRMTFPEFQAAIETANKVYDGYRVPTKEKDVPFYAHQLESARI